MIKLIIEDKVLFFFFVTLQQNTKRHKTHEQINITTSL